MIKHNRNKQKLLTDSSVPSVLRCWAGVGNDQRIADFISGSRKATNMGQGLVEKTFRPKIYNVSTQQYAARMIAKCLSVSEVHNRVGALGTSGVLV